jgi:hypothetical protein
MKINFLILAALCPVAFAQVPAAIQPAPPTTPKASAPIDLTGYWVSLVTEDWRYRMLTAPRYDYYSIPLNEDAKKVAYTWDEAKTPGESCRNFGAPTIMRVPGRVHVTWENNNALKFEMDAGKQTRILNFGPEKSTGEASLQGVSTAQWQTPLSIRASLAKISAQNPVTPGFPGIVNRQQQAAEPQHTGTLKVVTTHLRPGFLRNNGVPFSANTTLTEYYDVHKEKNGDVWLVVTSIVDDPQYLDAPWVTTTHFRKQNDANGWDPQACKP